jgi:hypothetical protein
MILTKAIKQYWRNNKIGENSISHCRVKPRQQTFPMACVSIKTCIKNQALIALVSPSIKTCISFYLLFYSCNTQRVLGIVEEK